MKSTKQSKNEIRIEVKVKNTILVQILLFAFIFFSILRQFIYVCGFLGIYAHERYDLIFVFIGQKHLAYSFHIQLLFSFIFCWLSHSHSHSLRKMFMLLQHDVLFSSFQYIILCECCDFFSFFSSSFRINNHFYLGFCLCVQQKILLD